jgi:hypothetical protein
MDVARFLARQQDDQTAIRYAGRARRRDRHMKRPRVSYHPHTPLTTPSVKIGGAFAIVLEKDILGNALPGMRENDETALISRLRKMLLGKIERDDRSFACQ